MKKILWVLLGCMLLCSNAFAQVPRNISYQGVLRDATTGKALVGSHLLHISYYLGSGANIFSEFQPVTVGSDAVFNASLGGINGFPTAMHFDLPYFIKIEVDGALLPGNFPLQSAPYALNTQAIGPDYLEASKLPINGKLWPVPIGADGKISASVLPGASGGQSVYTINGAGADPTGNITILPGANMTITPNINNHAITLSSTNSVDQTDGKLNNIAPFTTGSPISLKSNVNVEGTLTVGLGAAATTLQPSTMAPATVTLPSTSGTLALVLKSTGVLSLGTVFIPVAGVTSADFVMVSRSSFMGSSPGSLTATANTGGVVVTSSNPADNGTVNVVVIRQ